MGQESGDPSKTLLSHSKLESDTMLCVYFIESKLSTEFLT